MPKQRQQVKNAPLRSQLNMKATGQRSRPQPLADLRRARSFSQASVAERLGMSQSEVSRLERRSDLRVSSLARYVEALGGRLELQARFPKGHAYTLRLGDPKARRQK